MDLALNDLQRLICHKTQPTNQPSSLLISELLYLTQNVLITVSNLILLTNFMHTMIKLTDFVLLRIYLECISLYYTHRFIIAFVYIIENY